MTLKASFSRKLAARMPMLASMLGMTIAFTSVIFFFEEVDFRRPVGVAVGFFFLLLAIWYAAHPFIKNERKDPELRREVNKFVDLAKELRHAVVRGDEAAFESIKEKMPAQLEMVIATARKSEAVGATSGE